MPFPVEAGGTAWFALSVKPRHEKAAAAALTRKGLESYLPLYTVRRRWSDRIRMVEACLFPGYVFCRFGFERRMEVLGLASVLSIVGSGKTPVPVPEAELEAVRAVLASGRRAGPWPYPRAGERVRIEHGAMAGVEGVLIREKRPWRVVVSVELLRRSVAVEIDREMISAVRIAARRE
jgi:transcription antitermination factor NusG